MLEGKPISICAKWCPTEGDSYDRKYNMVAMICKHMKIIPRQYRTEMLERRGTYVKHKYRIKFLNRYLKTK